MNHTSRSSRLSARQRTLTGAAACAAWLTVIADRMLLIEQLPLLLHWLVHGLSVVGATIWIAWTIRVSLRGTTATVGACTLSYLVFWQAAVFVADVMAWDYLRATFARWGTVCFFLIGLGWLVWWVDLKTKQRSTRLLATNGRSATSLGRAWNPYDLEAWYYGRKSRKLNQSICTILAYSCTFLLALVIMSQLSGCREIYEMPAGGGKQQQIVQTIKIQKIIRKRFVINPYSAILFQVPEIDKTVNLNLKEITKHQYEVGDGEGEGAGFSGGTFRGKVRFIRLEYSGGDWDQDFGIGGDMNMLSEYNIRTKHKISNRTESRRIIQLKNFPRDKAPPLVYMTGQKNISLSNNEIKTLREYLTGKHGMILADNGGSRHWENQFFSMMNRVLPDVRPVPVPLDDVIHRVPYQIPFLPIVAPHGNRKEAMGWYKDGRWLCYYHPGDIGDAWSDGHAGVNPEIWEACYQLGTNILFYAHSEYNKWLDAQTKSKS